MGNMRERAQDNLWGLYIEYLWEIFMWARNSLWAYVGIYFCEWANEISAKKFVAQHHIGMHEWRIRKGLWNPIT